MPFNQGKRDSQFKEKKSLEKKILGKYIINIKKNTGHGKKTK